jgi:hypothetical protein
VLGAVAALAPSWSPGARAADDGQTLGDCDSTDGCPTSALDDLVGGFTGATESDLWGWMIGGGQSGGSDAIVGDLNTIVTE